MNWIYDRFPEEGQRVLVGFFYRYRYADREAEAREYVDIFTYENGEWIHNDADEYKGLEVSRSDIKVVCWMPIPTFEEVPDKHKSLLGRIREKL